MTLLVIGGSGHLGSEVCRQALSAGTTVVATFARTTGGAPAEGTEWKRLDLADRAAVSSLVDRVRPSTVVNAAYDKDNWSVTADGAGYVAVACARVGARLVHLSSDALHSGRPQPYVDTDPPTPVTPYGASKAAAETAVRLADPAAVLVRTSLILGGATSTQIRGCLDLLAGRTPGVFFTDEYRCPIDVTDLAAAVLELAASDYAGLINVAGQDAVSRAELGRLVALRYGLDPSAVPVRTLAEAGVVRPAEVRLDISRARSLLRTTLRGARTVLAP